MGMVGGVDGKSFDQLWAVDGRGLCVRVLGDGGSRKYPFMYLGTHTLILFKVP
jgi:hypothetical protein